MVVIWRWDGTVEQVRNLAYPNGYPYRPDLINLVNIAGKNALELTAVSRVGNGSKQPGFSIYIPTIATEFYRRYTVYFPADYSLTKTTGGFGWLDFHELLSYCCYDDAFAAGLLEDRFHATGILQALQHWAVDELYLQTYYMSAPTGNDAVVANANARLRRQTWHTIQSYVKIHETAGQLIHWLDGVEVFNIAGICTDPRRVLGVRTSTTGFGHYTDTDLYFPQKIYMGEFTVQTEPFVTRNITVDSSPQGIPFTIRR